MSIQLNKVLCDLGLPHFLLLYLSLHACNHPPLHCFLALPLKAVLFIMSFYTGIPLPEILYSLYVISIQPLRPKSNVISSAKSPLIPSSRVNNSLFFCFPRALSTYHEYSVRTFNVILLSSCICLCCSSV